MLKVKLMLSLLLFSNLSHAASPKNNSTISEKMATTVEAFAGIRATINAMVASMDAMEATIARIEAANIETLSRIEQLRLALAEKKRRLERQ